MENQESKEISKSIKPEIHLSVRQLQYIALINQGKTKHDAARLSGYSENTVPTHLEKSSNLRKALLTSMELNGLNSEYLGKKIMEGVNAQKTFFSTYKGSIQEERKIPDNETQHKYVKTALEIRGDLQENQTQVSIGLIEIPTRQSESEWNGNE